MKLNMMRFSLGLGLTYLRYCLATTKEFRIKLNIK